MQEKAYKLSALQENISNYEAKDLIDKGYVFSHGEEVVVARTLMSDKTKFSIVKTSRPKVIFKDKNIITINKPYAHISEEFEKKFSTKLLSRLDKETSGVILLCGSEDFREICVEEFKEQRVCKSYVTVPDRILTEEIEIDGSILTIRTKNGALSETSEEDLSTVSISTPIMIQAKKTLAKIIIKTGRAHQIRAHTKFIKRGIIGDEKCARISSDRMCLHNYEIRILNYQFKAELDSSFSKPGFEIKNLDF